MRIAITGYPNTGKTTLAKSMGEFKSTDSLIGEFDWSEASLEASYWFDAPEFIIEGVTVPRALRKWKERHPNEPPPIDKLIILEQPFVNLSTRQIAMGKGIDKVLDELYDWLKDVDIQYIRQNEIRI